MDGVVNRANATGREAATVLVVGPFVALAEARTAGVALFERRPPMHTVVLGPDAAAFPAGLRHRVTITGSVGCVAYLDPCRFTFEDASALAETWRRFVPGRDDLRDAFRDAVRAPRRHIEPRLLRALSALETENVATAAAHVGLSTSRLTHLVTATLGASPLAFRTWFKLRRALHVALLTGGNLTEAAHAAGFADSAHLTRTCKQMMGVRPAEMLPHTIYMLPDE